MMPWGHFAVAYVPIAVYALGRTRRLPSADYALVLLVATQLPDLIDKPFAWSFHILPSGRSLAHSVVFACPYVLLVTAVAWYADRSDVGAVFAFGYLSHIYADLVPAVLRENLRYLPNLYWPLLPVEPDINPHFFAHFARVELTTATVAKLALPALVVVFYSHLRFQKRKHRQQH